VTVYRCELGAVAAELGIGQALTGDLPK
jgi:hypothetical protein